MNFFGTSGHLNIVDARIRGPHEQVSVKVKQLHSSDEETDKEENKGDSPSNSKHGSLSRRHIPNQRLRNRKNNREFRSVWYDEEQEVEDVVPSMPSERGPGKGSLRKATSLGNLLEIDKRERAKPLTKNMISSPLCPRKIQGNWTEDRTEDVPPEIASIRRVSAEVTSHPSIDDRVERIDARLSDVVKLDEDTLHHEYRKALSMENLLSIDAVDFKSARKGSLDIPMTTKRKTVYDSMELQPLNTDLTRDEGDSSSELHDDVAKEVVPIGKGSDKALKKGPSLENLFKFSTLDNRNKRKNVVKLDISAPIQPRKIEESGDVPLDSLDTKEVTNLLRMKNKSKSTNVSY